MRLRQEVRELAVTQALRTILTRGEQLLTSRAEPALELGQELDGFRREDGGRIHRRSLDPRRDLEYAGQVTRLVSVAAAVLLAIVVFAPGAGSSSAAVQLRDVAGSVGLDFRQGAFRFGVSADPVAMMGSGLCWLDYDRDGWLDLFVVNSYAERDSHPLAAARRAAAEAPSSAT